jgi:manganese/zinc/iron transport system substrate-binding protein
MIGDVASEIGGSCVAVESLMGPGSDPHLFRASAGDITRLRRAQLILYGGLGLEGQLGEVLAGLSRSVPTVAVSEEAVPEARRLASAAGYAYDPHVWLDASQWADAALVIGTALAHGPGVDAQCAAAIDERAASFHALLNDLHDWALRSLSTIPDEQRVLVTAHDAFEYFGRAYDIEVIGVQGISTETEAAVADIRRVADLVVSRAVPAVFIESTINPRTLQAVIDGVRQRGGTVRLGAQLYADSLGADQEPEGTYVGLLVHDVAAITTELGGTVAALPASAASWLATWYPAGDAVLYVAPGEE